jgi:hypothetical protein
MKKLKYKLEIEIWGIEVEETAHYVEGHGSGWYKFEYSIRANGGKKKFGQYDGSWSNQTKANITRVLKRGYASELVFQQII